MKIESYFDKLEKNEEFQKFQKEEKGAYFCSAFFVVNLEEKGKGNETQMDFYSPEKKKVISFKIVGRKIEKMPLEKEPITLQHKKFIPKELQKTSKIDMEQLQGIIVDGMHNKGITDNIKKMMLIYQDIDGKSAWNCTCFLSGLSLLQTHIEDESKSVLYMEKKSFMDMIVPLKPGEKIEEVLKKRKEEKNKFDVEKSGGNHEGFIG